MESIAPYLVCRVPLDKERSGYQGQTIPGDAKASLCSPNFAFVPHNKSGGE
jgi:hypothetical protein